MARVRVQVPAQPQQPAPSTDQSHQVALPQINAKKAIVIIGTIGVIIFMWLLISDRNHLKHELAQGSTNQSQNDTQKYQSAVADLVETPNGVTPVVSTPTQDKLTQLISENALYKNTKAGDVFLYYKNSDNSALVVVYRPASHKVVLVIQGDAPNANTTTKP